jgi:Mg2+ and Co2+ transporter CorA
VKNTNALIKLLTKRANVQIPQAIDEWAGDTQVSAERMLSEIKSLIGERDRLLGLVRSLNQIPKVDE